MPNNVNYCLVLPQNQIEKFINHSVNFSLGETMSRTINPNLVPISFKIDLETLEKLNKFVKIRKIQKSQVIRDAIEELLREGIRTKPRRIWGYSKMYYTKIDLDLLTRLDDFVKRNNLNRSLAIRLAIQQYLEKFEEVE